MQGMAALRSALDGTEETGSQLDRSDQRLHARLEAAKLRVHRHAGWGSEVLREQGDFAKLAAAYLPGD